MHGEIDAVDITKEKNVKITNDGGSVERPRANPWVYTSDNGGREVIAGNSLATTGKVGMGHSLGSRTGAPKDKQLTPAHQEGPKDRQLQRNRANSILWTRVCGILDQ